MNKVILTVLCMVIAFSAFCQTSFSQVVFVSKHEKKDTVFILQSREGVSLSQDINWCSEVVSDTVVAGTTIIMLKVRTIKEGEKIDAKNNFITPVFIYETPEDAKRYQKYHIFSSNIYAKGTDKKRRELLFPLAEYEKTFIVELEGFLKLKYSVMRQSAIASFE